MAAIYTTEQLQHAWLARRRPDWPPTFEAAMADELLSRLVRLEAAARQRAQRRAEHKPLPAWMTVNHPPAPAPPHRASPTFDARRAAANDLDDDDDA